MKLKDIYSLLGNNFVVCFDDNNWDYPEYLEVCSIIKNEPTIEYKNCISFSRNVSIDFLLECTIAYIDVYNDMCSNDNEVLIVLEYKHDDYYEEHGFIF